MMASDVKGKVQLPKVLELALGGLEVLAGLSSGVLAGRFFVAAVEEPPGYMADKALLMAIASSGCAVLLLVPGAMMLLDRRAKWWLQLLPAIPFAFLLKDLID